MIDENKVHNHYGIKKMRKMSSVSQVYFFFFWGGGLGGGGGGGGGLKLPLGSVSISNKQCLRNYIGTPTLVAYWVMAEVEANFLV